MIAALAIALLPLNACDSRGTERWATTENTNVAIDWDKVNEAYKTADGPADFEKRVNEIYEGDEVISVSVQDLEGNTQVVTGFFDKDKSGTVQEGEKIFTIKRNVTGEGTGQLPDAGPRRVRRLPLAGDGHLHRDDDGLDALERVPTQLRADVPGALHDAALAGQRAARLAERLPGGQPGPLQPQDVGVGVEPLVRRQAVVPLRSAVVFARAAVASASGAARESAARSSA